MKNKKNYLAEVSDIPMMEYNNIFTGNLIWIERGLSNDIATYDLVVREIPQKWNFYVMDGVERFIDILLNYGFDDEAVKTLKEMGFISGKDSEEFYRNFKFTGDAWTMRDGTVFFPGEPILRITAPLLEANLLTAFVLNVFSYPVRIMTKNVRLKMVTEGRAMFISGAMVRLPGFEQGYYSAKDAHILGSSPTSPFIYRKHKEQKPKTSKLTINFNHAVIKSFSTERDAFTYIFDNLAERVNICSVMVDTYDLEKGLEIFIEEFKKRKNIDPKKFFVTVDSGDIAEESLRVRKVLDENGLSDIGINAMSNLTEESIDNFLNDGIPIDIPITATEQVNVTDNPRLEAVYKMAELTHEDGSVEMKAKLTKKKESYPGRKQVFRVYKDGKMIKDIVGFEDENLGTPLLEKFIGKGKQIIPTPSLDDVRNHLDKQLSKLPDKLKNVHKSVGYSVQPSEKLKKAFEHIKKHMASDDI
ncbi:hypothetical protein ACFL05_00825 [Patescibacteria group bacterium]